VATKETTTAETVRRITLGRYRAVRSWHDQPMTALRGAHAVITGGSSGIGLATARLLALGGARVSLVARDETRLDDAARELSAEVGGEMVGVGSADVRDGDALRAAIARLTEGLGPCDILVTAAGSAHPGYFEQLDESVFRDQMDVDYFGTLHAVRAVVPSMIERRHGHLVLVGSTAALIGVFGYSAYAPAKYAVRGLAETLRVELAPHGIVVSCAYPPDTNTPGLDRENMLKPAETERISASIKPRDPIAVAQAIVRGIERDRLVITADLQTAALARAAGLLGPYVRRTMDRTVRKVRRQRGTFET
jgi:3-dehydrosphinganine reductase